MPILLVEGENARTICFGQIKDVSDVSIVERAAVTAPGAETQRAWRFEGEARAVFDARKLAQQVDLTLSTMLYKQAFVFGDYAQSMATALVLTMIVCAVALVQMKVLRSREEEA